MPGSYLLLGPAPGWRLLQRRVPCWLAWPEPGLASRSILNSSIPRAHQPRPAQQEAQHLHRATPPAWQAVQAGTASICRDMTALCSRALSMPWQFVLGS